MPDPTKKHADSRRRRLSAACTAAKVAIAPLSPQHPQPILADDPTRLEIQQYCRMKDVSGSVFKRIHSTAFVDQMPQIAFSFIPHGALAM
jgi:hypothetical protein